MSRWRLPTLHELFNIFDHEQGKSKIKGFNSDFYWSSTMYINDMDNIWGVNFNSGSVRYCYQSNPNYVRCVRTKKNGKLEWSPPSEREVTFKDARKYCERMNNE